MKMSIFFYIGFIGACLYSFYFIYIFYKEGFSFSDLSLENIKEMKLNAAVLLFYAIFMWLGVLTFLIF